MISKCTGILKCKQNPFNAIGKKYKKPCAISTIFTLPMFSECSGILNFVQHSFNMIWSGVEKLWKPLCKINIFNLSLI